MQYTFIGSIYTIPGLGQVERDLAAMLVQTMETSILLQQRYLHLMSADPYLHSAFTHHAMLLELNVSAKTVAPAIPVTKPTAPTATEIVNSSHQHMSPVFCHQSDNNNNFPSNDSPSMVIDNNNNNTNAAVSSSVKRPKKFEEKLYLQTGDTELAANYYLQARETSKMMKYINM